MAKKTLTTIERMYNEIVAILGKAHQYKIEDKKIVMTRASFIALTEAIEADKKSRINITKKAKDDDLNFKMSIGKASVDIEVRLQVHDRGETKATQKTYKIMGTSFYDGDHKTHTIKVDWNNLLNVYQMWSTVGYKSYHRLEQTPDKKKMWKAYKEACDKALKDGYTIRKVTEEAKEA